MKDKVIYEGIAEGDIAKEIKEKFGIDINSTDEYEIVYDGATDNSGISETIYTEYKLVKKGKEPIPIDIDWVKPIIPETDEIPKDDIDSEMKEKKQDMLDKYYGNSKKKEEYKRRIKRFKSHIVEKDFEFQNQSGETVTGKYKTVEDYKEKSDDEKFLQLEEFAYRLERMSKAESR